MDGLARLLARPGAAGRVLVVVAHPDDEVLGCGGLLARLPAVRVVHVTDGAPQGGADARRHGFDGPAAYAAARAAEAEAALALAGHGPDCLSRLGVADQQASLHLAVIARALVAEVAKANWVLTHAYEGGHADHDAVAFAAAAALRLAAGTAALVEMPFYRAILPQDEPDTGASLLPRPGEGGPAQAGPDGVPGPGGPHPSSCGRHPPRGGEGAHPAAGGEAPAKGWQRQRFLRDPSAGPERVLTLDAEAQALKRRMLAAHRSQGGTLQDFAVDVERYRVAPAHDFARLPHGGDLLYERHGWGLTGLLWLDRVRAALAELGLEAVA